MGPDDYIETVLTCKGDYYDPEFPRHLERFSESLRQLIKTEKQRIIIKKVEPWNSVRVTFNIPVEAAQRLRLLAEQGNPALREIGVLAVQIEGDRSISLTIAGKNNERTELVLRTSDGPAAPMLIDGGAPAAAQAGKALGALFASSGGVMDTLDALAPAPNIFRPPGSVAASPLPGQMQQPLGMPERPGPVAGPSFQTRLPGPDLPSPGYSHSPHVSSPQFTSPQLGQSPSPGPFQPPTPPPPYPGLAFNNLNKSVFNKALNQAAPGLLVNLLQHEGASPQNNGPPPQKMPPPEVATPQKRRRKRNKDKSSSGDKQNKAPPRQSKILPADKEAFIMHLDDIMQDVVGDEDGDRDSPKPTSESPFISSVSHSYSNSPVDSPASSINTRASTDSNMMENFVPTSKEERLVSPALETGVKLENHVKEESCQAADPPRPPVPLPGALRIKPDHDYHPAPANCIINPYTGQLEPRIAAEAEHCDSERRRHGSGPSISPRKSLSPIRSADPMLDRLHGQSLPMECERRLSPAMAASPLAPTHLVPSPSSHALACSPHLPRSPAHQGAALRPPDPSRSPRQSTPGASPGHSPLPGPGHSPLPGPGHSPLPGLGSPGASPGPSPGPPASVWRASSAAAMAQNPMMGVASRHGLPVHSMAQRGPFPPHGLHQGQFSQPGPHLQGPHRLPAGHPRLQHMAQMQQAEAHSLHMQHMQGLRPGPPGHRMPPGQVMGQPGAHMQHPGNHMQGQRMPQPGQRMPPPGHQPRVPLPQTGYPPHMRMGAPFPQSGAPPGSQFSGMPPSQPPPYPATSWPGGVPYSRAGTPPSTQASYPPGRPYKPGTPPASKSPGSATPPAMHGKPGTPPTAGLHQVSSPQAASPAGTPGSTPPHVPGLGSPRPAPSPQQPGMAAPHPQQVRFQPPPGAQTSPQRWSPGHHPEPQRMEVPIGQPQPAQPVSAPPMSTAVHAHMAESLPSQAPAVPQPAQHVSTSQYPQPGAPPLLRASIPRPGGPAGPAGSQDPGPPPMVRMPQPAPGVPRLQSWMTRLPQPPAMRLARPPRPPPPERLPTPAAGNNGPVQPTEPVNPEPKPDPEPTDSKPADLNGPKHQPMPNHIGELSAENLSKEAQLLHEKVPTSLHNFLDHAVTVNYALMETSNGETGHPVAPPSLDKMEDLNVKSEVLKSASVNEEVPKLEAEERTVDCTDSCTPSETTTQGTDNSNTEGRCSSPRSAVAPAADPPVLPVNGPVRSPGSARQSLSPRSPRAASADSTPRHSPEKTVHEEKKPVKRGAKLSDICAKLAVQQNDVKQLTKSPPAPAAVVAVAAPAAAAPVVPVPKPESQRAKSPAAQKPAKDEPPSSRSNSPRAKPPPDLAFFNSPLHRLTAPIFPFNLTQSVKKVVGPIPSSDPVKPKPTSPARSASPRAAKDSSPPVLNPSIPPPALRLPLHSQPPRLDAKPDTDIMTSQTPSMTSSSLTPAIGQLARVQDSSDGRKATYDRKGKGGVSTVSGPVVKACSPGNSVVSVVVNADSAAEEPACPAGLLDHAYVQRSVLSEPLDLAKSRAPPPRRLYDNGDVNSDHLETPLNLTSPGITDLKIQINGPQDTNGPEAEHKSPVQDSRLDPESKDDDLDKSEKRTLRTQKRKDEDSLLELPNKRKRRLTDDSASSGKTNSIDYLSEDEGREDLIHEARRKPIRSTRHSSRSNSRGSEAADEHDEKAVRSVEVVQTRSAARIDVRPGQDDMDGVKKHQDAKRLPELESGKTGRAQRNSPVREMPDKRATRSSKPKDGPAGGPEPAFSQPPLLTASSASKRRRFSRDQQR